MKRYRIILTSFITLLLILLLPACSKPPAKKLTDNLKMPQAIGDDQSFDTIKAKLIPRYQNQKPKLWGEKVPGVITRIETGKKVIALTFDACGGKLGSGYDAKLIDFLNRQKVPATLFINARWIDANHNTFLKLARNSLFEIENHGTRHKPLSVNGSSVYNIKGTKNVGEVIDEVLLNDRKIKTLTGRKPKYFRTGTAYYDEVAVKIANNLGEKIIGYNVLGDAGATYPRAKVKTQLLSSTPGSIVLLHMNHPSKDTAEGIMDAIPILKRQGYTFVKLEDYNSLLR